MPHFLVICADDFGMNPAVSQGIAQLALRSRLSATSVMALAPDWPRDVALLRPLRGQLDVGLHLDWTSPFALAAGHGHSLPALMLRTSLRQLHSQTAQEVIERQLDLFEAHWQAPPDHVDGHQHIQQFPVIREALMAVLTRRYTRQECPWLRISQPLATDFKARTIAAMGAPALESLAQHAGRQHSQRLNGIYDFTGSADGYAQRLASWVQEAAAHPALLMMCHPAHQNTNSSDSIAAARWREFQVLSGPLLPDLLQRNGVQLALGKQAFKDPATSPPFLHTP